MNIEYYKRFEKSKSQGLKAQAKLNIEKFIDSFSGIEEKEMWVKSYLEAGEYGHKIRHELYESVIFPVLVHGYRSNDSWSLFWLAETIQNVFASQVLHKQIDFNSDSWLLKKCFEIDESNRNVRLRLLDCTVRCLDYAIHEWPCGVLYAPDESPDDMLTEIEWARSLDVECRYSEFLSRVEAIVKEDKSKKA